MYENTKEMLRMGRRRFLKRAAELGVSYSALQGLTKDVLRDLDPGPNEVIRLGSYSHRNKQEVLDGGKPKYEANYYTIPKRKWVIVESAVDARSKLEKFIQNKGWSVPVGIRSGTKGGGPNRELIASYQIIKNDGDLIWEPEVDFQTVRKALPTEVSGTAGEGTEHAETVHGIPVKLERNIQQMDGYTGDYNGVPGGVYYEYYDNAESKVLSCTTCTRAYDNAYDDYVIVGAGHCLDNSGITYQNQYDASEDAFGYPRSWQVDNEFDAGKIQKYDSANNTNYRQYLGADGGGFAEYVDGYYTRDKLNDHVGDSDWIVIKQGWASGRTQGYLTEVSNPRVDGTWKSVGGDSGGPVFHKPDNDTARMVGVNNGHYEYPDGTWTGESYGTIMESVAIQFRLRV